jgi:hypothetical protein
VAIIAGLVDADTSSVGERNAEKCAEAIDCKIGHRKRLLSALAGIAGDDDRLTAFDERELHYRKDVEMEIAEDLGLHAAPPSDEAASCQCSSESGAFSAGGNAASAGVKLLRPGEYSYLAFEALLDAN